MLNARSVPGIAVLGGFLYAIGSTTVFGSTNSVERYSPSSNTWQPVASMNYNRKNPAVGVLNGQIYVLGGHNNDLNDWNKQTVESYDRETDTWTVVM